MADGSRKRKPESGPPLQPTMTLDGQSAENQAMRDAAELLRCGEEWFQRCPFTARRPMERVLPMLLSTLDNLPTIKDRCTQLLKGKPERKDIKFDVNKNLTLHCPKRGRQMIENAADFLSGQFQNTTENSAGPLLDMIKVNEKLQATGGPCLRTRIENVLAAHSSCDLPTPAKSEPDDSACAGPATSKLQQAFQIAQQLKTSDLQELIKQCTELLETRNGTTPMQLEGEAAAGAASGKTGSQKRVHFAENSQSDQEEDAKVKAWQNDAWHPDVQTLITALKTGNIVDVETLEKSAVDTLKSLPFEVAIVCLQKRQSESGRIQSESAFIVKNCNHLRNQWGIEDSSDEDANRSDQDESDDDDDNDDKDAT